MTFKPRLTVWVLAGLATLSACGDGTEQITGENSVISTTSIPVIGPNGTDITAVNQQNFPLEGALPLDLPLDSETPDIGAAEPISSPSDNVLGAESAESVTDTSETPSAAVSIQPDFFVPASALSQTDTQGQALVPVINAITRVVAYEYASVTTTNDVFSDDTLQISKRIGEKTSCDQGFVESLFDMNGTAIIDGSVLFSDCGSNGYVLNGEVVMASVSDANNDELVVVGLRSVSAARDGSASFFDGILSIVFNGDTFIVTSDLIEINTNGSLDTFTSVDLNGLMGSAGGARALTGSATFNQAETASSASAVLDYEFADVNVLDGETVPNAGTASITHADGSRVDFNFETGDINTFTYTVAQTDSSSTTVIEQWANVGFRVPLP